MISEVLKQTNGFQVFLIPDTGSLRVTRCQPTIASAKKLAQVDIDDMLKICTMIEMVVVKDRTAIQNRMIRRAN